MTGRCSTALVVGCALGSLGLGCADSSSEAASEQAIRRPGHHGPHGPRGPHHPRRPRHEPRDHRCIRERSTFDFDECRTACIAERGNTAARTCHDLCDDLRERAERLASVRCREDRDGDGVPDTNDRCRNTRSGANVTWTGCPDRDGDGVPDRDDRCPNTPATAVVSVNGCVSTPTCDEDETDGHCEIGPPRCETQLSCDRVKETPILREIPLETRQAISRKFLGSPSHDARCPGDRTPPAQPRAVQPAAIITPLEVGDVTVEVENGAVVDGPVIPLTISWNPVVDSCDPVTYSVLIESFHCHQVNDLVESVTYRNRGWCTWRPVRYSSQSETTLTFDFPLGKHLYDVHVPFATELGWDLSFTGTRTIVYMPFWLRVRLIAHDGNGTPSGSLSHADDRFFVLYADGTVPLETLTDLPVEPQI